MALTIPEEMKLKQIAAEAIEADAVAALAATREAETKTARARYEAAVRKAGEKYRAGVHGLEK